MLVYWLSTFQFFCFFILGLGDVHVAVDSASAVDHAHVTGLMLVN